MCVALIGGMDRLEKEYESEAKRHGVELRVFTKPKTALSMRLKNVDAMVLFTGKMSHRMKNEAIGAARSKSIPVMMAHSCGVCSLRNCLHRIVTDYKGGNRGLPVCDTCDRTVSRLSGKEKY